MAILATDIKFKLSITSGTAGNQNAQPDPNASLGKYISTTQISDTALNNLFDNISYTENADQDVEYRCLFVHNAHASLTWQGVVAYIYSQVSGGADVEIGVDPTAASPIGSTSAQAVQIANEGTAPSGVTFSAPTTPETGISLGDIPAGYCRAIWVKRIAKNTAAIYNDGATIKVRGGTAA